MTITSGVLAGINWDTSSGDEGMMNACRLQHREFLRPHHGVLFYPVALVSRLTISRKLGRSLGMFSQH